MKAVLATAVYDAVQFDPQASDWPSFVLGIEESRPRLPISTKYVLRVEEGKRVTDIPINPGDYIVTTGPQALTGIQRWVVPQDEFEEQFVVLPEEKQ